MFLVRVTGKGQCGPMSGAELKNLAACGAIGPQDQVQQVGSDAWWPASAVGGLFPAEPPPLPPPLPAQDPIERGSSRWLWGFTAFGLVVLVALIALRVSPWGDEIDQPEPTRAAEPVSRPPPSAPPVEPIDIRVTSQVVQRIEGIHRYVFAIENRDAKPFEGTIVVTLVNANPNLTNGHEVFRTKTPLEPNGKMLDYMEIGTGPVSVHGDRGVARFRYSAVAKGQVVASGEDDISAKYEER